MNYVEAFYNYRHHNELMIEDGRLDLEMEYNSMRQKMDRSRYENDTLRTWYYMRICHWLEMKRHIYRGENERPATAQELIRQDLIQL